MEQQFSTSKVTVEYSDPHDVYKLVAPGLIPLLPLRNLHWKSHAGPPRSIDTLHVDLVAAGTDASANPLSPLISPKTRPGLESLNAAADGFQTQAVGGRGGGSADRHGETPTATRSVSTTGSMTGATGGRERRHQIPGLRRTPYLKLLLVRCDDNDTYKTQTRSEIRDWVKQNTPPTQSSRRANNAENHDAFEWLIVHVVIPNTVAATQPRITGKSSDGSASDSSKVASRWRGTTSTLLEKMLADFSGSSAKGSGSADRVAQIRIGINDVPYDVLPRVVPAVPSGYTETAQDVENAWTDLVVKMKAWILSSFDMRVSQYEEDIKEKDAQRTLPGWNFCTFFILKEGLARGFESVGLVEDALVGYDELSVGLDAIIQDQAVTGSPAAHGGALLGYTEELADAARRAVAAIESGHIEFGGEGDEEPVNLQGTTAPAPSTAPASSSPPSTSVASNFGVEDDLPINATKKPYRELILANNVSLFDFRCYIFARQIGLLFRLGNASVSREQLLAKAKEQRESLLHGVAPRTPALKHPVVNEAEDLSILAEVCRRTLEFIPAVSQVMRQDIFAALMENGKDNASTAENPSSPLVEVVDNVVSSFAFSVAQQVLAQTSTKALPIPASSLTLPDTEEQKVTIPEPKTMMHPARTSSLHMPASSTPASSRPPLSPGFFPGPGRSFSGPSGAEQMAHAQFLKVGLEELAARRAELYTLSRNVLQECGRRRGWSDGWDSVPLIGEPDIDDMADISLDGEDDGVPKKATKQSSSGGGQFSLAGVGNRLLRTALDNNDDFYRLYETLTQKALRHYTVADHPHSVEGNLVDLAVLKYHLSEYQEASSHFKGAIPFFAERGWSLLELSMLVMYSRCLKELGQRHDYVKVVLKLLSKAAMAENERHRRGRAQAKVSLSQKKIFPDRLAIKGLLQDVLATSKNLSNDLRVPMHDFFFDVTIDGLPFYHERKDGFSLTLTLSSLLVDELEVDLARVRMSSLGSGGPKEVWLASDGAVRLKPGKNKLQVHSNAAIPGIYELDQIRLRSGRLSLHWERGDPNHTVGSASIAADNILRDPKVKIYQRAGAFDVRLFASRQTQLDKSNSVEVELSTGWNTVTSCDLRVRAATGGLRLLTSDAKLVRRSGEDALPLSVPPEGGLFSLGSLAEESSIRLRLPFTVEQEVAAVAVRIEVSYTTEHGTYELVKTPSVGISLALSVNVQDVFKHGALFSRFTVSTASSSPLRLLGSELLESELFESSFGERGEDVDPVIIFPKQPASLLYKIVRKRGSRVKGPKTRKTMYLKLRYSVLQNEIDSLVEASVLDAFETAPASLRPYSRLAVGTVVSQLRSGLLASALDLERAALLGSVPTASLTDVQWERFFIGLGRNADADVSSSLASFIRGWRRRHPRIPIPPSPTSGPEGSVDEPQSILIPVDVPSITVVHTADIQLQQPVRSLLQKDGVNHHGFTPPSSAPVAVNQLLPATLHLKWSRIWDTGFPDSETPAPPAADDLEFSYEVTAPQDTWLLGGRRKGHFVIPGLQIGDEDDAAARREAYAEGIRSTADTEADIPLLLVPLREGWLPYPAVEIREVRSSSSPMGGSGGGDADVHGGGLDVDSRVHCETDYRNLGETVRVVADRQRLTLSLDASGPGGGPLVLESESRTVEGRVVV